MSEIQNYEFFGGDPNIGVDASGLDPEFAADRLSYAALHISDEEVLAMSEALDRTDETRMNMTPEERAALHEADEEQRQQAIAESGEGFND